MSVTMELNIERETDFFICKDMMTLQLLLGSKGVAGNLHMYNVQKIRNDYYVRVSDVEKRLVLLTDRKERLEQSIKVIRQILKQKLNPEECRRLLDGDV